MHVSFGYDMLSSQPDPLLFQRATKVIAVLDVVESVRLMEQDEDDFIERWQAFVRFARGLLPQRGGRMHKSLGDGLMLEFSEAQGCIRGALELQEWMQQRNACLPPESRMQLRIGAHLAEFVADEYDIYGTDVNLAARVAGLAGPGEIVMTASLKDRVAVGLDADVEDLGECFLKHMKEPVRVYRVGPAGPAPLIESRRASHADLRPTIAVIPFATRSAEPALGMLGEALADELIAALSRTSELHVISRLSTTVFRDRQGDVAEIQRHLGANYVLSGTCRSSDGQLALFAELIDARTGHVVWADSLKGTVKDLFAADDEIIGRLVAAVSSSVIATELQRARTHSLPTLEGYTLLLGSVSLMHRNAAADFERAYRLLEHLIERSRRHPLAYAWLAQWHVLRVQQGWSTDRAREAQLALDCTKRALDNAPDCALALTAEGFVHANLLRDPQTGFQRYEEALHINPNDSLAWLLKGTLHAFNDEGELALAGTQRALQLSPLDPLRYFYDSLAATAALSAGDYGRARELARRSLRHNRSHTSTLRVLIVAETFLGNQDEMAEAVRQLLALEPQFSINDFIGRSPSMQSEFGLRCAQALRLAGVPE